MLGSGVATAAIIPAANNAETKTFFINMFNSPEIAIRNICNGMAA